MEITSLSYLIFVGVSLVVYWALPHKFKWWVLLVDSLVFYALNTKPITLIYPAVSVLSVWGATLFFEGRRNTKPARIVLILTLVLNVGMLSLLKYTNLFLSTVSYFTEKFSGRTIPSVKWYASLAISFYTLQIISYLLDCYWGVEKAEKNPLKVLLFTIYFPLTISGPICRYNMLSAGLFANNSFDYDRVTRSLKRTGWGFAKKLIVADRLSVVVGYMFASPDFFTGPWTILAAALFVIQLYFDFTGCMDIALGISGCFGVELPENFRTPFFAKTVQEFWQRWHMTLGTFLKEYIMYPVLKSPLFVKMTADCKKHFGKKGKKIPTYLAMLIVWLLMGLWHGSSWKYVLGEGLWFWLIIVLGQIPSDFFKKAKARLHIKEDAFLWKAYGIVRTSLFFTIGMIFFNAADLKAAFHMISCIFRPFPVKEGFLSLYRGIWPEFGGKYVALAVLIIFILQTVFDFMHEKGKDPQEAVAKIVAPVRWVLYLALIFLIIFTGSFGKSSFIYFGF